MTNGLTKVLGDVVFGVKLAGAMLRDYVAPLDVPENSDRIVADYDSTEMSNIYKVEPLEPRFG